MLYSKFTFASRSEAKAKNLDNRKYVFTSSDYFGCQAFFNLLREDKQETPFLWLNGNFDLTLSVHFIRNKNGKNATINIISHIYPWVKAILPVGLFSSLTL